MNPSLKEQAKHLAAGSAYLGADKLIRAAMLVALEHAELVTLNEAVEPVDESDTSYNAAINHAISAIASLKKELE